MSQQLAHSSEDLVHARFTKRLRVLTCICLIVVSVPLLFSFLHVLNVYVILGESMVPTLNPGDLFLTGPQTEDIQEGTVIVFRSPFNELVVHRVIDRVAMSDGLYYVTKGDANDQTDSFLVAEDAVLGFPSLVIPKLGFYFLIPRELALMSMMGLILAYTSLSYTISQPGDDALIQPHWLISTLTRTKHRVLTALPFTIEYETEMAVGPSLDSVSASTLQMAERLALPEHSPPTPPTAVALEPAVSSPIVRVTTKPRIVRIKRRPVEAQVEDELDAITTVAKSQVRPTLDAEAERDGDSVPTVTITRSARVPRTRRIVRMQRRSMDRRFSKRDESTSRTQSARDDDAIRHIVRVKRRPVVQRKRRSVGAQVTDELAQITAAAESQTSLDDAGADRAKPSVRIARVTRSSRAAQIHAGDGTLQRQRPEKEGATEPTTRSESSSSDQSASITDIASLRERVEKEKTVLSEDDVQRILKILEQASARRPRDWIVRRSRRTRKRRRPNPY